MVRLLAASALLGLALAARINLETADDVDLDNSAVDENNDEEYDEDEVGEPEEAPVHRCSDSSNDPSGRRRGRIDCGCLSNGNKACFIDDPHDVCSWYRGSSGIGHYCRRRRSAPRPAPRPRPPPAPPPPPPPPPEYIPGNGRFWEYGSHRSSGTASSPGILPNGWYDPNSEYMLSQSSPPGHDGDPYDHALMTRHVADDPHHCFSGWAFCCNTEFNCCANCPYQNADRPEWGPRGFSQCLGWFPQCGTNAPHPNLPQGLGARVGEALGNAGHAIGNAGRRVGQSIGNFWGRHHDEDGFHWR